MPKNLFNVIVVTAALLIVGFLTFFDSRQFLKTPKSAAADVFFPVSNFFYKIGGRSTDYLSALFSAGTTAQINKELAAKNLELQSGFIKLQEVARENDILKAQLEIKKTQKENYNYIMADVFGYSPTNLDQYVFINKGSQDGVAKDAAVVISGNVLVGKVGEVFPAKAKIILLNNSNSAINALTQINRSSGVLKGSRGTGVFLEMVPQDKNLETGEQIISAGSGNNFPKGLLIGEVSDIMTSDVEAFKRAKIKPAADIDSLETVFVISP